MDIRYGYGFLEALQIRLILFHPKTTLATLEMILTFSLAFFETQDVSFYTEFLYIVLDVNILVNYFDYGHVWVV